MARFGNSKKEVWARFADEIGGEFIDRGKLRNNWVEYNYGVFTIYLDNYTVSTGSSTVTYTRIRAPYVSYHDYDIKISKVGFGSKFAKFFGRQYMNSGDMDFDSVIAIRTGDEYETKQILEDSDLKNKLVNIKRVSFDIKDKDKWTKYKFQVDERELHYQLTGVLKDIDELKRLFDIFKEMLDIFVAKGIARDEKPKVKLFKDKKV